jgi:hypothetical protein
MLTEAGVVINGLRLLLEGYKLAKERLGGGHNDDPDPEKLEEVIADVEATARDRVPNLADVEQEIDRKFNPEQAEKVKSDLNSIALLADPPRLEEFDYCATLTQLTKSLQVFARKTELFRLRGSNMSDGTRYLYLERTSRVFVPEDVVLEALVVLRNAYGKAITSISVVLIDSDSEIAIKLGVEGHLKRATSMGEQYKENVGSSFAITAGSERNRLLLTPDQRFGPFAPIEYRVTAENVAKTIEAMRNDLSDYAAEIAKERKLAGRVSDDVREIVKNLSDSPS